MTPHSVPSFAPGVRLQDDPTRGQTILQGPERLLVPDEIALEVLAEVDGKTSLAGITEALAARFQADPAEVGADVSELLDSLVTRGFLRESQP
ncbi:MAG: pyrroloquinoline quinone biosynthesis peptide chaperone PqqD [Rhodospirillaceae bacterium]